MSSLFAVSSRLDFPFPKGRRHTEPATLSAVRALTGVAAEDGLKARGQKDRKRVGMWGLAVSQLGRQVQVGLSDHI